MSLRERDQLVSVLASRVAVCAAVEWMVSLCGQFYIPPTPTYMPPDLRSTGYFYKKKPASNFNVPTEDDKTHDVLCIEQLIFNNSSIWIWPNQAKESCGKETFESNKSDHGSFLKFISSVSTQNGLSCIQVPDSEIKPLILEILEITSTLEMTGAWETSRISFSLRRRLCLQSYIVVHREYLHFDKERPDCTEEFVTLLSLCKTLESMLMTCKEQSRNTCGVKY